MPKRTDIKSILIIGADFFIENSVAWTDKNCLYGLTIY